MAVAIGKANASPVFIDTALIKMIYDTLFSKSPTPLVDSALDGLEMFVRRTHDVGVDAPQPYPFGWIAAAAWGLTSLPDRPAPPSMIFNNLTCKREYLTGSNYQTDWLARIEILKNVSPLPFAQAKLLDFFGKLLQAVPTYGALQTLVALDIPSTEFGRKSILEVLNMKDISKASLETKLTTAAERVLGALSLHDLLEVTRGEMETRYLGGTFREAANSKLTSAPHDYPTKNDLISAVKELGYGVDRERSDAFGRRFVHNAPEDRLDALPVILDSLDVSKDCMATVIEQWVDRFVPKLITGSRGQQAVQDVCEQLVSSWGRWKPHALEAIDKAFKNLVTHVGTRALLKAASELGEVAGFEASPVFLTLVQPSVKQGLESRVSGFKVWADATEVVQSMTTYEDYDGSMSRSNPSAESILTLQLDVLQSLLPAKEENCVHVPRITSPVHAALVQPTPAFHAASPGLLTHARRCPLCLDPVLSPRSSRLYAFVDDDRSDQPVLGQAFCGKTTFAPHACRVLSHCL